MECGKCGHQKVCKFRENMQKEYEEICKTVTHGTPEIKCDDFVEVVGLEVPDFLNRVK